MIPEAERKLVLRTRLPLYLLILLIGFQLVEPDPTWMRLLVGLAAWVGISYLWALEMRDDVYVLRQTQGNWIIVGDQLEESFELINKSLLPVLWATVRDHSEVPGYVIDRVVVADGQGRFRWHTRGICEKRGVFTLGPWSVGMGDPFGLFEVTLSYPQVRTLMVYPRIMRLPQFSLPQGTRSGRARRLQSTVAESVMVSTVRPYVPGDSLHRIHWAKTAQQQKFMVKQFDLEPAGDLWLVLDLDSAVHVGEGKESTLEYGVILAASLAAKHLAENRSVGLIAYGQKPVLLRPKRGQAHLWRILQALTHVEPDPAWPLARVLKRVQSEVGRGRTLLAITPSTQSDWVGELVHLRRQDVAVAALLLDASSFTGVSPEDVLAIQRLLAEQHTPTHIIAKGYPFRPLVTYKRKRTEYRTLWGTGRVIAVEVEEEV